MDREAWWSTVYGTEKRRTQLSTHVFMHACEREGTVEQESLNL